MYTPLKSRIARIVASLAGATLVTFISLHQIASHALPDQAAAGSVRLAATTAAPVR